MHLCCAQGAHHVNESTDGRAARSSRISRRRCPRSSRRTRQLDAFGGVVLIVLGVKILAEHTGWL
jgi:threonine/homoserine/homoserine lactone efflux protein